MKRADHRSKCGEVHKEGLEERLQIGSIWIPSVDLELHLIVFFLNFVCALCCRLCVSLSNGMVLEYEQAFVRLACLSNFEEGSHFVVSMVDQILTPFPLFLPVMLSSTTTPTCSSLYISPGIFVVFDSCTVLRHNTTEFAYPRCSWAANKGNLHSKYCSRKAMCESSTHT